MMRLLIPPFGNYFSAIYLADRSKRSGQLYPATRRRGPMATRDTRSGGPSSLPPLPSFPPPPIEQTPPPVVPAPCPRREMMLTTVHFPHDDNRDDRNNGATITSAAARRTIVNQRAYLKRKNNGGVVDDALASFGVPRSLARRWHWWRGGQQCLHAGVTTIQRRGEHGVCWRDDEAVAGRRRVLARWCDNESAADRTTVP